MVPQADHNQALSHNVTQVCPLQDNSVAFHNAYSLQDNTEESQGKEMPRGNSKQSGRALILAIEHKHYYALD